MMATELGRALRAKFRTPAAAMAALGLGANLLAERAAKKPNLSEELAERYPRSHALLMGLCKRYGSAQKAIKALGLDENSIPPNAGGGEAGSDPIHSLCLQIENLLTEESNEVGGGSLERLHPRIVGLLEQAKREAGERRAAERVRGRDHIPSPAERHVSPRQNEDSDPSERTFLESEGESERDIDRQKAGSHPASDPRGTSRRGELVGAAGDDDPKFEDFKNYLQDCGLSEDEAEEACRIVQDSRRRARSNGKDQLPVNRLAGGRGGHFGGARNGGRFDGSRDQENINAARTYAEQIAGGAERPAIGDQIHPMDPNEIDHGLDRRRIGRDRTR
jgi:hypothetical protein